MSEFKDYFLFGFEGSFALWCPSFLMSFTFECSKVITFRIFQFRLFYVSTVPFKFGLQMFLYMSSFSCPLHFVVNSFPWSLEVKRFLYNSMLIFLNLRCGMFLQIVYVKSSFQILFNFRCSSFFFISMPIFLSIVGFQSSSEILFPIFLQMTFVKLLPNLDFNITCTCPF